jgi:hypothetical protein
VPLPLHPALLATLSGQELIIVVLALGALAVIVGSAALGIVARLRRGLTGERDPAPPSDGSSRRRRR